MLEHLRYALNYGREKLPVLVNEIRQFRGKKPIHELTGRAGIEAFVGDVALRAEQ